VFVLLVSGSGPVGVHVGVVDPLGVEHLELPVVVVAHGGRGILVLGPVDVGGLGGEAHDVGADEHHAGTDDDEEGLKGGVVLQGGQGHALHFAPVVIFVSSTDALEVGMISCLQDLRQEHV